jgi:catechol 2,3-dioxygenase-like lactoylglutathione lyase family enzyme
MQPIIALWAAFVVPGINPLNIKNIDHIAINCVNLRKSLEFYGRILGLKQLQTVNCGEFDITYFALPNESRLELFDYHARNREVARRDSDSGLRHVAFQVENVAMHEKALRAAGVKITLSTCDLPDLGARVLLFLDPNGVTIEFCEKLPQSE